MKTIIPNIKFYLLLGLFGMLPKFSQAQTLTINPSNTCEGNSVTFTIDGYEGSCPTTPRTFKLQQLVGGTWSTAQVQVDNDVFNHSVGINGNTDWRIEVENSSNATCAISAQEPLTVNPKATVNISTSPTSICQGGEIDLNGSFGGVATSMTWSSNVGGSFSSTSGSMTTFTPPSGFSGNAIITLSSNNPPGICGVETDQVVITVDEQPTVDPSSNISDRCQGGSFNLSAGQNSAVTSVTWSASPSNAGTFSNANSFVTVFTSNVNFDGAVTISISTNGNGECLFVTDQLTLNIYEMATVDISTLPTSICENSSIELNGSFGGGASSMTWSSNVGGSFSSTSASMTTFTPPSGFSGDATITLTTNNPAGPCPGVNDNVVITVDAQPIIDPSSNIFIACPGENFFLSAGQSSDVNSVTWSASPVNAGSFSDPNVFSPTFIPNFGFEGQVNISVSTNASGTCTSVEEQLILEVGDVESPLAFCTNVTAQLDGAGQAFVNSFEVDAGSVDNCGGLISALNQSVFDCNDLGENLVTLIVNDISGNVAFCDAIITIEDVVTPIANCQDVFITLDNSGFIEINPFDIGAGSTDNCGILDMSLSQATFDCNDLGLNQTILTVIDNSGNISSCSSTVSIEDQTAPIADCQDIFITLNGSESVVINPSDIDNGSFDNCGILSMSLSQTTFDCNDLGSTPITLSLVDNSGNFAPCNAIVTVEENESPVASCQDISIFLSSSGQAVIAAADIDNGSTDNCGVLSVSLSQTTFDCSDLGANPVTLIVTDNSGNTSPCNAMVTVEENDSPVASCQDISIFLSSSGQAVIAAADIDNGSTDNCGVFSMSLSQTVFDCGDVGANQVNLIVTDNVGNSSSCNAIVTVEDGMETTANCQDVTISLAASGQVIINSSDIDNGSTDACGIASTTISQTVFDCSHLGSNLVTFTVIDNSGNVSSCNATVTIEDTTTPVANCQDVTISLDISGQAIVDVSDVDNGTSDACGISNMSVSQTDFDCSQLGSNQVTLTVIDNSGNTSSCNAIVTVEDVIVPTVNCQDVTTSLDVTGQAIIDVSDVDNGTSDACGISNMSISQTNFDCSQLGSNEVTLTVTDNSGNISSCNAIVTVEDVIVPTVNCQDVTTSLDVTGQAIIDVSDVDNGTSDACGISNMSISQTNFDCSQLGSNQVTLTVTDNSGNTSSCNAVVTVEDVIVPTVNCQNTTISLDVSGQALLNASDVDNGSSDNCEIMDLNLSQTTFDCSHIGDNEVTFIVTDASGNTASCIATVTVDGTSAFPPVDLGEDISICNNSLVTLDAGAVGVSYEWTLNGNVISGVNQQTLEAQEAGIYAVGVTNSSGCFAQDEIVVEYFESLAFEINVENGLCGSETANASVVITNNIIADSYEWSDGSDTDVISNLSDGMYVLTITDVNGCQVVDSASVFNIETMNVDMNTMATPTSCESSITISEGTAPYDILWSTGAFTETAVDIPAGSFFVTVTDANGCILELEDVCEFSTSNNNLENRYNLKLYPNPTSDFLYVEFDLSNNKEGNISIFNAQGTQLHLEEVEIGSLNKEIDCQNYPNGIYYLQINVDQDVLTKKFVIQK